MAFFAIEKEQSQSIFHFFLLDLDQLTWKWPGDTLAVCWNLQWRKALQPSS